MSIAKLRQHFTQIFHKRVLNESTYLSIGTYITLGEHKNSFTNKDGKKVDFPKELQSWPDYANLMIRLKDHKIEGWKHEFGWMHIRLDVGCSGQYRLYDANKEYFCILNTWPPYGLVPCHTQKTEIGYQYIEFDVMEDGTITSWSANPSYDYFLYFGEFYPTKADREWIAEQVDKKDTPEGNPDIKAIPYYSMVATLDKNYNEINRGEFDEFFAAMDFLREQSKNPNAYQIHIRTADGWNMDFFRDPEEESGEYCDDSFEDIDWWIEEEKVSYIKRLVIPDELEIELHEIQAICEGKDPESVQEWLNSDTLPF